MSLACMEKSIRVIANNINNLFEDMKYCLLEQLLWVFLEESSNYCLKNIAISFLLIWVFVFFLLGHIWLCSGITSGPAFCARQAINPLYCFSSPYIYNFLISKLFNSLFLSQKLLKLIFTLLINNKTRRQKIVHSG